MSKVLNISIAVLLLATAAWADWDPGDPYKMHYPQLPKVGGWDVAFNLGRLADDWQCSQSGDVTDVHFWVSWESDQVQLVTGFSVRIHSDIPDPDDSGPLYSMPAGDFLYEHDFGPGEFTVQMMADDLQGWFDPLDGTSNATDHTTWAQINVVDMPNPFFQEEGSVYWLEIDGFENPNAGWKESGSSHFRDDAVGWWSSQWNELRDPITSDSLDLAFVITPEPATLGLLLMGGLALLRRRRGA